MQTHKPRVSFPAAPASFRKQGVNAAYFSGSSSASRISPERSAVSGTSDVGIMNRSASRSENIASENLLSCPVDHMVSRETSSGGATSSVAARRSAIQKERCNRAGKPRPGSPQQREPAAGELRSAGEVENPELLAQLPVRLRRKLEPARFAPAPHLYVGGLVGAAGHGVVHQIGHIVEQCAKRRVRRRR